MAQVSYLDAAMLTGVKHSYPHFFNGTVTAKTVVILGYVPAAGTLLGAWVKMGTGTCTVAIQIGGVSVTSLSALAVTTTGARTAATGANALSAGSRITAVITSPASTPADLEVSVDVSYP